MFTNGSTAMEASCVDCPPSAGAFGFSISQRPIANAPTNTAANATPISVERSRGSACTGFAAVAQHGATAACAVDTLIGPAEAQFHPAPPEVVAGFHHVLRRRRFGV